MIDFKTNVDNLSEHDLKLYSKEIHEAVELGLAGDEIDVNSWLAVADLFSRKLEEQECI